MFDAFKLMGKFGEIKDKMKEMKEQLPFIPVYEETEDQKIKVYATADKSIKKIEIDDSLLGAENKENLQVQLVEILNKTKAQAEQKSKEETKKRLEGVLPDMPGLDMDNLPF